jgi:hypothetical protein
LARVRYRNDDDRWLAHEFSPRIQDFAAVAIGASFSNTSQ